MLKPLASPGRNVKNYMSRLEMKIKKSILAPLTPLLNSAANSLYQNEEESCDGPWYWNSSSEDNISDSDEGKQDNSRYYTEPVLNTEPEPSTVIPKISVTGEQDSIAQ